MGGGDRAKPPPSKWRHDLPMPAPMTDASDWFNKQPALSGRGVFPNAMREAVVLGAFKYSRGVDAQKPKAYVYRIKKLERRGLCEFFRL